MLLHQVEYAAIYHPDDAVEMRYLPDRQLVLPQQQLSHDRWIPLFNLQRLKSQRLKSQPLQLQPVLVQAEPQFTAQAEPQSAGDFYALGVELQRAGQIPAAIQAYQTAIALESTFDVAYINLGLAFIQLGQFDTAQQTFQQVLTLPDRTEHPASIHTLAHYNLAIILHRQRKVDEAITEVQHALEITPDFAKAQQLLQQLQDSRAGLTHFLS